MFICHFIICHVYLTDLICSLTETTFCAYPHKPIQIEIGHVHSGVAAVLSNRRIRPAEFQPNQLSTEYPTNWSFKPDRDISCTMATSRYYLEGEQVANPRPSRNRRVPTYLEDYVLDYPPLRHGHPSPADSTQGIPQVSQDLYKGYITPAHRDRDFEWRDLSSEMKELQIRTDSATQAYFTTKSPVYGPYQSLHHIDLSNTGLEPSVTVASSPHYEETLQSRAPYAASPTIKHAAIQYSSHCLSVRATASKTAS